MASDKGTNLPITQLSGLQINYKDSNSCLNPPVVTNAERNALINSSNPMAKIKPGTIVYNIEANAMQVFQNGDWVALAAGGGGNGNVSVNDNPVVVGNLAMFNEVDGQLIADSSIPFNKVVTVQTDDNPVVIGNLAMFNAEDGKIIEDSSIPFNKVVTVQTDGNPAVNKNLACFFGITGKLIADSGINVAQIIVTSNEVNNTPLYRLSNLGALQFGNNTNLTDTGVILLDSLTPITFQTQGTGVDAQVCTIINGELGAGSSSPSALLEINSTTGGFLLSRLTTDQINALVSPKDGMVVYDTILKQTRFRQNGQWVSGNGNIDNLTLKVTSVTTNYYQPTKYDCIINVDVTGVTGTTTIDLFSPYNVPLGIVYIIKDKTGHASTKNIKISTIAGFRIDKDYDYTINTDYGWVEVFNNGQNWGIISKSPPSTGNVVGPSSSAINNILTFNNITGTLIKDSGLNLSQIVSKYLPFSEVSFIPTYNILDNDFFVVVYVKEGGTTVNLPSLGISSNINRLIIIKQAGLGTTTIRPNDIDSIQNQETTKCVLSTNGYVWLVGTASRYWMPICSGGGI